MCNPETQTTVQAEGLQNIEVDPGSLTSSVTAYPVEHGRRYHAYKDGSYFMPNDENEQDRLDLMHHLITILTDGKSCFAPIKEEDLKRGIWSIEMGDKYPNAEVRLLWSKFPTKSPPNVKFEVDDLEAPWNHTEPFDLIFCRYLDGAISDWPALVSNMFASTKPGGWVELQGYDAQFRSDDGTLKPDSYLNRYFTTIEEGITKMGKVLSTGPLFEGLLKDKGFANIHVHTYKLPIGTWPKDKKMKEAGTINTLQYLDGMEAFSYRLLTSVLDWTLEEVQVFNAKVAEEIKSNRIHAYYTLYIVYGQKPKDD
ncbi:hypothetical protein SLS58_002729 [Diplodia intermedia]|uniref:Methyltransferase n=1 Tax=Diplodia intermedia TaxID=856260 RepID=A0ABR3TZ40_9PEZI